MCVYIYIYIYITYIHKRLKKDISHNELPMSFDNMNVTKERRAKELLQTLGNQGEMRAK
jgi:hypothetical protein